MRRFITGLQTFILMIVTVGVALAQPVTKGASGYSPSAYLWFGLICAIIVYGTYDACFCQGDS
jgi:hypothetical protein